MFTESMPTNATPAETKRLDQAGRDVGMVGIAVVVGPPMPIPSGREQNGAALDFDALDITCDQFRSCLLHHHPVKVGDQVEGEPCQVEAVRETMERDIEIGAGVGDHVDPPDAERGPLLVAADRVGAGEVLGDDRARQAGIGDHSVFDWMGEVDETRHDVGDHTTCPS